MQRMEGFLDHLEDAGYAPLLHAKTWKPRYFQLNAAFHVLEYFKDESLQKRKGKIDLMHAEIATAEELGEMFTSTKHLLSGPTVSSNISIENSRRFVFRLTEHGADKKAIKHHYLCAEVAGAGAEKSRQNMEKWLAMLKPLISATRGPAAPVDLRDLNNKIAMYTDHMHVSAYVAHRRKDKEYDGYEILATAWILQRELVEDGASDGLDSWQILEYSCSWKVLKTLAEVRNFDAQLRHFFRDQLRDIAVPTFSAMADSFHRLIHSSAEEIEAANNHYAEELDVYFQKVLCLPAFSVFGSDGSTMLDQFLGISAHLNASFRQLERETGQNLQLRQKKIVAWAERKQFELLYKLHLEIVHAQEAKMLEERQHRKHTRSGSTESHRHHHHHEHHHRRDSSKESTVDDDSIIPPPPPPPIDSLDLNDEDDGSVRERIARIGQKLIQEAFKGPTDPSSTIAVRPPTPASE